MIDTTTPQQDVERPAEAGFSTNMYLNHPVMGRLQFTFRGATSRDWGKVLLDVDSFAHYMKEKGWYFDGAKPAAVAEPQQQKPQGPVQPEYQDIDDSGHQLPVIQSFVAERLSVKFEDGKYFYKVMGGKWSQYGIAIWPEVLIAAGLGVNADGTPAWGNPPNPPSINGWTAEYTETLKDGKPRRKVTRLLPQRRTVPDEYEGGTDPRNGMPFGGK